MAHVVILDQDPMRQQWYQTALPDHTITVVETAIAAVRMVQQVATAAIIAEYFDGSGTRLLEELERLTRNIRFAAPPVYLTGTITALDKTVEKATLLAQNRGARDFIPHPISRERFRELLGNVLEPEKGGRVVGRITFLEPPESVTSEELVQMTLGYNGVPELLEATIGARTFQQLLATALSEDGHGRAQEVCAVIGVWAVSDAPTLDALDLWNERCQIRRNACDEILYRMADRLLGGMSKAA